MPAYVRAVIYVALARFINIPSEIMSAACCEKSFYPTHVRSISYVDVYFKKSKKKKKQANLIAKISPPL